MPQNTKKKVVPKKRSEKYEEKVHLDMTFEEAIKALAIKSSSGGKPVSGSAIVPPEKQKR